MPLYLKKGDITKFNVDAIVNATDEFLSGGGGVDRCIHEAAGFDLAMDCMEIDGCKTGKAVITPGHELAAKYVIHTAGPRWKTGSSEEKDLLSSCYESSLELAAEHNCKTIAFPLISAGTFGFPEDDAMGIAKAAIEDFLESHDMTVYLVAYRSHTYNLGAKLFDEVSRYVEETLSLTENLCRYDSAPKPKSVCDETVAAAPCSVCGSAPASLKDYLKGLDESFPEMLERKIAESGITNAECYNRALSTKSVFSKIKNNPDYRPTKSTVAGFVFALRLPYDEAKDMFEKAGYSLTKSSVFDIIVEWFLKNKNYDVYELNDVLLEYDQALIGCWKSISQVSSQDTFSLRK